MKKFLILNIRVDRTTSEKVRKLRLKEGYQQRQSSICFAETEYANDAPKHVFAAVRDDMIAGFSTIIYDELTPAQIEEYKKLAAHFGYTVEIRDSLEEAKSAETAEKGASFPHNNFLDFNYLENKFLQYTGVKSPKALAYLLGLTDEQYEASRNHASRQQLQHMELLLESVLVREDAFYSKGSYTNAYFFSGSGSTVRTYATDVTRPMSSDHPLFDIWLANHAEYLSPNGLQWELSTVYPGILYPHRLRYPADASGLTEDTLLVLEDFEVVEGEINITDLELHYNHTPTITKEWEQAAREFMKNAIYKF